MSARTVIGVMGAGEEATNAEVRLAERLGELVAREGWVVLTGGRPAGVMEAAVRGAKRVEGSLTVGVLPTASGPVAEGVDLAIYTGFGEARDAVNVLSSDVVITCGDPNAGTTAEAALAVKLGKPLVMLGGSPEAVAFFAGLSRSLIVVSTPEDAVAAARRFVRVRVD